MGCFLGSRRKIPVSRPPPPPPPPSRRVTGNCLSGVGYGVPYDGLTHDDLAGGEVTDAEGSPRVVSVDVEHDALGPAWRQIVLVFWSPWSSPSITLSLAAFAAFAAPSYRRDGGPMTLRKPVSGRKERKTSVLWPKQGQMMAAAG